MKLELTEGKLEWPCPHCKGDLTQFVDAVAQDISMYHQVELDNLRRSAPLCNKHQLAYDDTRSSRSGCPYCVLIEYQRALSEIDYLLGEPNEMHVSGFDIHATPEGVVQHLRLRLGLPSDHEV